MNTRALRRISQLGVAAALGVVAIPMAAHAAPPSTSVSIVDRTLNITGSNAADNIAISVGAATPNLLFVDFGNDGIVEQQFDRSAFDALNVTLGNGNDRFTATGVTVPQASTVDGGNGDDSIVGTGSADHVVGGNGIDDINSGAGDDTVHGGTGNDFVDGGVGHDVAVLDNGDDIFRWDPGEGSDDVDGRSGNDVLVFNGAVQNETMSLSAVGARAVFLRSPGSIMMNLDAVEQLDLHTFGGADDLTVDDVTGTLMQQVDVDLSASGTGVGGDGQPDRVTLNGTTRDDHVDVSGQGTQVDVAGLPAGVHISGSNAADPDRLHVNTRDGNDTVTVDASALALIGVTTDLGGGQL